MADISKDLPPYYKKSRYMSALMTADSNEFDRLYAAIEIFAKNFSIDTASEAAIKQLERGLGIQTVNESLAIRKSRVKAKMRGVVTTTPRNLKLAIESYNVLVDIVEHIEDYSFEVIFLQPYDVPEEEIKTLVEDLKPAHLGVDYRYEYIGTFEFSDKEYEYDPGRGFADGKGNGGYLGYIGN